MNDINADEVDEIEAKLKSIRLAASPTLDERIRVLAEGLERAPGDAGPAEAAQAERKDSMNVMATPYPARASHALRLLYVRRWVKPLAVAAALLVVAAVFLLSGVPGTGGLTWAQVQGAVAAGAWIHYTTVDAAAGAGTAETWYSPGARRAYTRHSDTNLPYYVLLDYVSKEKWLYNAAERSLTIYDLQPAQPEGNVLQAVLDPSSLPEWPRRVTKIGSKDGLTRFDVSSTAEGVSDADRHVMSVWVDDKSQLPVRAESYLRSADGASRTTVTTIDYPASGPADVYALGVPRDAAFLDARPTGEVANIMDIYNARRQGFANVYTATVISDGSATSYAVSRDGDKWRVEDYFPSAVSADAETERPVLAPGAACYGVIVYDGRRTAEYTTDKEPRTSAGRSVPLSHTLRTGADPAYASWPEIPLQPLKLVKSDDTALAGLLGIELRGGPPGTLDHYWLDPQHDYICRLYTRHETKGSRPLLADNVEVLEFAQLADGRWYARTKVATAGAYRRKVYIEINERPQFAAATFDTAVGPWAACRIVSLNPSRQPLTGVTLAPVDAAWEPAVTAEDGALVVTNVPVGRPADVVLMDDAHGLAGRLTLTPNPGGVTAAEAVLAEGIRLIGFVKNAAGAPVEGASVLLEMRQKAPGRVSKGWGLASARTDSHGRYEFGVLLRDGEYRVQIYKSGLEGGQEAVTIDAAKGVAAVPDAVLTPRTKCLAGRVTDKATGAPVAGMVVNWTIDVPASCARDGSWDTWRSNSPWQVETDKNGRWQTDLANSRYLYKVFVTDARYEPSAVDAVEAGQSNVDFHLVPVGGPHAK